MNLKILSDEMLMQKTDGLVKEERERLANLLRHFREIERRRLYSDFKYGSLHKMLVGHYGYSDDEAYLRISAMRLLKDVPEVEEKITNGELTLSHLGLAQTFFRKEAKIQHAEISKDMKLEILEQISDQSLREAERFVLSQSSSPEEHKPDKVRVISEEKMEYRFTADNSLESKIAEVKGLLAHKYPSLSMAELLNVMCDMTIETLKNEKTGTRLKPRDTKTSDEIKSYAQTQREVWQESQFKCSNCGSIYAMEKDHRHARAMGGSNAKENLRILCRSCNQRAAIKTFGQAQMDFYLN
jgi:DNA-directed RNA polymerase subunit RPC12/RpoP